MVFLGVLTSFLCLLLDYESRDFVFLFSPLSLSLIVVHSAGIVLVT